MRRMLLAGTAVLGLMTGGALAASPTAVGDAPTVATAVERDQIAMRTLIGKTVVDVHGDSIGTVADVLLDASGKVADTAVIRLVDLLGGGEKLIAVAIIDLTPLKDQKTLRVDGLTWQQVSEMKAFRHEDAVAASAPTAQQDATATAVASAANPADIEPRLLIGHEVVDIDGKKLGTVDNVLMTEGDNRPSKAIIKSGGFLGMGAKLIAVDVGTLHAGPNQTSNVLSPGILVATGLTQELVRKMDGFHYDPKMRTYRASSGS
jgi:sporulation protein YlmC with PRC-barrel domain